MYFTTRATACAKGGASRRRPRGRGPAGGGAGAPDGRAQGAAGTVFNARRAGPAHGLGAKEAHGRHCAAARREGRHARRRPRLLSRADRAARGPCQGGSAARAALRLAHAHARRAAGVRQPQLARARRAARVRRPVHHRRGPLGRAGYGRHTRRAQARRKRACTVRVRRRKAREADGREPGQARRRGRRVRRSRARRHGRRQGHGARREVPVASVPHGRRAGRAHCKDVLLRGVREGRRVVPRPRHYSGREKDRRARGARAHGERRGGRRRRRRHGPQHMAVRPPGGDDKGGKVDRPRGQDGRRGVLAVRAAFEERKGRRPRRGRAAGGRRPAL